MVIKKIKTIVEPEKGVRIGPVIVDASIMALQERTNVSFTFNGKPYVVLHIDLLQCCKEVVEKSA